MNQLFALSLGIAAMAFAAAQARAQTLSPAAPLQCGARAELVALLWGRYAETPRAMGLVAQDRMMELFASDSGSWTLLVTTAEGLACLLASGQSFQGPPAATLSADDPA